ncbi:uncharacterized protein LAJ45_06636 [Morchella importuna]|uniref:uncharacterized protein n=1 Tax=Morchella importuna TaxID=1174673 RepID=UPI001E8E1B09|nr:uncharacterized protein LAJ45_06636 [Morchella importuna]KAH8149097.1 hypothetical protein LAJ45_06636 [Morchella importuna]
MDSQNTENYLAFLNNYIEKRSLQAFYPHGSETLVSIAKQADSLVKSVHPKFVQSPEVAMDMSLLALYRIVLLLDDSGSMKLSEGGRRIKALQVFLTRITEISTHFVSDGITIRWFNKLEGVNNVKDINKIPEIVKSNPFRGWTKIGTELRDKVLEPFVLRPARENTLKKPVMVLIITDGEPAGEAPGTLKSVILQSQRHLRRLKYARTAVSFQIARVGNSPTAKDFLHRLDVDPEIGYSVDCIAEEGIEKAEQLLGEDDDFSIADLWLTKLLLGAIMEGYDQMNDGGEDDEDEGGKA